MAGADFYKRLLNDVGSNPYIMVSVMIIICLKQIVTMSSHMQLKAPRKECPEKGNRIARRRMPSNWRADRIRHRCKQLSAGRETQPKAGT